MSIERIPDSVIPTTASAGDKEVQVNDSGYCWRKVGRRYIGEGFLPAPGCKLIDVQECRFTPREIRGVSRSALTGDAGSRMPMVIGCSTSTSWTPEPEDLLVRQLRVDGNLSVPVIEGKIPVYSRGGVLLGHIDFEPLPDE